MNQLKAQKLTESRKESSLRVRNSSSALHSRIQSMNESSSFVANAHNNSILNGSGNLSIHNETQIGELSSAFTETIDSINNTGSITCSPGPSNANSETHLRLVKRFAAFREKKERKKREIANYIEEFERRENRKFSKEDRVLINHLYVQYNIYKKEFDELEKKLASSLANIKGNNEKNALDPLKAEKSENEVTMHSTSTSSTMMEDSSRASSTMLSNYSKCKSVSPRKAHLARILGNNSNGSSRPCAKPNSVGNLNFIQSYMNNHNNNIGNNNNNNNTSNNGVHLNNQYLLNTSMNTSNLNTSGVIDTSTINFNNMSTTSNMTHSHPVNNLTKENQMDLQRMFTENKALKTELANLRQILLSSGLSYSGELKSKEALVVDRAVKKEEDAVNLSLIRMSTEGDEKKEAEKAKSLILIEKKYIRKIKLLEEEHKKKVQELSDILKAKEGVIERVKRLLFFFLRQKN